MTKKRNGLRKKYKLHGDMMEIDFFKVVHNQYQTQGAVFLHILNIRGKNENTTRHEVLTANFQMFENLMKHALSV